MGTDISYITPETEMGLINELLKEKHAHYVTYTNVHVIATANHDSRLKDALANASIVSPDGMPVVWAAKILGYVDIEKCSGPDMMKLILEESLKAKKSHYFYGSTEENLKRLKAHLEAQYPGIMIKGFCAPPFRELSDDEDRKIVEEINRIKPDYIWVGLGAPKQEIWMVEHYKRIDHGVMFGVGAAFNFLSGSLKRAPKWMQTLGLEWLYRLFREPKKLWKRYLRTNSVFTLYLLRLLFTKNKGPVKRL